MGVLTYCSSLPSCTEPVIASDSLHIGNTTPLQTHFILETPRPFRLISYWKRLGVYLKTKILYPARPYGFGVIMMKLWGTLSLLSVSLMVSGMALADGTHSVKIKITNGTNNKIEITSYNGKDKSMTIPHKVNYIDKGGTRTVKCHGQGKHKCNVAIKLNGTTKYYFWGGIRDNTVCTIANKAGTFLWTDDKTTTLDQSSANLTGEGC